jgi:uncharacterized protein (TIGR03437 family)
MDAHTPLHRTAVLLATALLTAAAASATAPVLTLSTDSIYLTSCSNTATVQVTATIATSFTVVKPAYSGWFTVSPAGASPISIDPDHPVTLTITQVQYLSGLSAATVGLQITGGGDGPTFTVNPPSGTCTPGSGQFTSNPANGATLALATVTGTAQGTLTLSNGTVGSVTYSVTPATTIMPTWLSVGTTSGTLAPGASVPITVTADSSGLITGRYFGTVTVTPTSSVTLSSIQITVQFDVGTSSGPSGGNLTLNGTSNTTVPLTFSATTDGDLPPTQLVTLQSSTGATTFTVTNIQTSDGAAWLGAGNGGILVSSSYPVTYTLSNNLTVGLTGAVRNLGSGTYTGTISLKSSDGATASVSITLTVNGGAAGVTVSPSNSYQFTAPSNSSTKLQTVFTVSAQSGAALSTPTYQSTNNWLSINSTGSSNYYQINATADPTGLADGTYTGSITIGSVSNGITGSTSISLTLVVGTGGGGTPSNSGILPTGLNFFYQVGSAIPTAGRTQLISVSGTQGVKYSAVADQDWITVSPASPATVTSPGTFTVTVNPDGLIAAATPYTGKVTVTGANGITKDVSVSLTVTASGTPVMEPVQTGDLVFSYQTGGSGPSNQNVAMFATDSGGGVSSVSVSTSTPWLSVTAYGNTVWASIVNLSTLQSGSYSGSFTVTSGTYANSPLTIPVVLVVNGGGSPGPLTIGTLNVFSAALNGQAQTQYLAISASTPTSFTASAASQIGNWLSVTPSSTYTNQNLTVTANPTGLAAGTYYGTITLVSGGVTQTVPVTFQVGSGGATGNVNITPKTLSFSYVSGATAPAAQPVGIANTTQGTAQVPLGVTISTDSGGNWLKTDFIAGSLTPLNLNISVDAANLAPGTYTGKVTIQPSGGDAVSVSVTLTVTGAPAISISTTTLDFTYQVGGQAPAAGSFQVTGNVSGLAFTAAAATNDGGKWLSVAPASGTAGPTAVPLSVKVSPDGLDAGTYTGTVTVAGGSGVTGGGTVTVTLKVAAPLPTISKVVNAATFAEGPIAPGEIVAIFAPTDGSHPIGPATAAQTKLDDTGKVSTTIGGVVVKFSGYAAPLTYAGAGQINAVVPYELKQVANPTVQVTFMGQTSNAFSVAKAAAAPGLFTLGNNGAGPGAILNQDNTVNGLSNPAPAGSTVVLYMTGEGETLPSGTTGKVTTVSATGPLTPQPLLPVGVTIDGIPATVSFYGEAPGMVSGVLQLNVVIPPGARSGAVPVLVSIGTGDNAVRSQSGVTVSVK